MERTKNGCGTRIALFARRCLGAGLAASLLLAAGLPVCAAAPASHPLRRVLGDRVELILARKARGDALCAQKETVKSGPLYANLGTVSYRHQLWHTCKATACATATNLLLGRDEWTTTAMGGDECINISWLTFEGSDGQRYRGVYCFDEYEGSRRELYAVLESALHRGIPVAVGIHSTRPGYTRHHWVVVVGRLGDDFLIVDPAWGEDGSALDHIVPMSVLHYAFGLTDYRSPHYVYMTYEPAEETETGD